MRKYLLPIMTALLLFSNTEGIRAQDTLFTIPDTVCTGHLVTPRLNDFTGNTYDWSFCSPQLNIPPEGVNIGNTYGALSPTDISIVKDSARYFGFLINEKTSNLMYWDFKYGIETMPIATNLFNLGGTLPVNPQGLEVVKDDIYYVFVIGGNDAGTTSLVRYGFANGLRYPCTDTTVLGNLKGILLEPKELFIAKDGDEWVGFTFNFGKELVRLNFGGSLSNPPTAINLGNIGGVFKDVSGINGLMETDNWYLHISDQGANKLVKLLFGSSLNNIPFAVDYGSVSSRLNNPSGIAITPECREYYGFTTNYLGSSFVKLFWDASIADTPTTSENLGNIGDLKQPRALSQFVYDNGALYLFAANEDSTVTRFKFAACSSASYSGSDEMHPVPFSYDEPGIYKVQLMIDQGTPNVRTFCKNIVVVQAPETQFTNDTLICQGDTITLHALFNSPGTLTWSPDYNISSTTDQVVNVWPDQTTDYVATVEYSENCILVDTQTVTVSKIAADAGADRTVSDGSSVVLGGPNTSIGDDYTYYWWPGDYITGSRYTNVTSAVPGQSITYYLEVRNGDGCFAIDSVNITTSCGEIILPNAFVPGSKNPKTSVFGIMNLQIVKLNFFRIYDRWGKLIFETENVMEGWDGKIDGVIAPLGVYVYEIDGFCIDQKRLRKSGNVTLIR